MSEDSTFPFILNAAVGTLGAVLLFMMGAIRHRLERSDDRLGRLEVDQAREGERNETLFRVVNEVKADVNKLGDKMDRLLEANVRPQRKAGP